MGTSIGSIRLTSVLGQGGMGEVYDGFDETLQRSVAVKSVRSDRSLDPDAKARFLHEARILSSMRHPNICLVHDFIEHGGDAFLVMERIEGLRLDRSIESGLDRRTKLDTAVQLAEVLSVAHARGIVHRDLKPENVMLTGDGVAKVLDFGIARLERRSNRRVDAELPSTPAGEETTIVEPIDTIQTTHELPVAYQRTTAGTVIGTPAYMSPEQAVGEEVSPASDVYSLGLIFQYLFTGEPTFEPGLETVALLIRAARGESREVGGLGGDIAALIRKMKSLDPEDRPTAAEVAHGLARIRSKPARRSRLAIAASLVIVVTGFAVKYTVDLRHERGQALAAQTEAETARDEAEATNKFLVSVLMAARPDQARGEEVTVRQVLDTAAAELPAREDLGVSTKARYLLVVGNVYMHLGLFDEARSALTAAIEIADGAQPIEAKIDVQIRLDLGRVEERSGSLEAARTHYARALEIIGERLPENRQARAAALSSLGNAQSADGDLEGARASYSEGLELMRQVKEPGDPQIGMMLGNLAIIMSDLGDCEGSIQANTEALEIFEAALGDDHPFVANVLNNTGNCQESLGLIEEAYRSVARAVAIRERVLGPEHPDTAQCTATLGALEVARGRFDEADELLERATPVILGTYGDDHQEYVYLQLAKVELALGRGDLAMAERLARDAYRTSAGLEGFHPVVRSAQGQLIDVLLIEGNAEQALDAAETGLDHRISRLGTENGLVGEGWVLVARARWATGDRAGARAALDEALQLGWTLEEVTEPAGLVAVAREAAAD